MTYCNSNYPISTEGDFSSAFFFTCYVFTHMRAARTNRSSRQAGHTVTLGSSYRSYHLLLDLFLGLPESKPWSEVTRTMKTLQEIFKVKRVTLKEI